MKTEPATASISLTGRLLRALVAPMTGLAIVLGLGGAWAINQAVETVNDRILGAAARAITESLAVDDGEITLELPPSAFGMLENNARDNIYYNIRRGEALVTGYPDLPGVAPASLNDGDTVFRTIEYRGHRVRVVAEGRRLPRIKDIVVVQVAETMTARDRIARRLLLGLFLLEAALIGISALMIPLAVSWGLLPLARLREEMDRRAASDYAPLSLCDVPLELRELVRAFNSLLNRLDTAAQGVRRFTADASHQMRTPLSIIRAHAAVLRRSDIGNKESLASIADIDGAASRLQRLLAQLLALARADGAATEKVTLRDVDLHGLAREAASQYAPQALRAGLDLQFIENGTPVHASTEPVLATEIIANFLDNAIRYNRAGGMVTVSVGLEGERARITVEDDGPGIAPADRERVFSRFTRLDRDRNISGSGLGLSIAGALAKAIDAELKLDAGRDGRGLRASLLFNKAKGAAKGFDGRQAT